MSWMREPVLKVRGKRKLVLFGAGEMTQFLKEPASEPEISDLRSEFDPWDLLSEKRNNFHKFSDIYKHTMAHTHPHTYTCLHK